MDKKKIPLVSRFSGAGGLDMGFENQVFKPFGQMILTKMPAKHTVC